MKKLSLTELRKKLKINNKPIQILVGMGTCGIASGARETFQSFIELVNEHGLQDVNVKQTGCIGLCYSEPTVEVIMPGMSTVYGNVDVKTAKSIVEEHIIKGNVVNEHVFQKPFADIFDVDINDIHKHNQLRIVLRNCGVIDPESIAEYIERDGYSALEKVLFNISADDVINELKKSGLRGRGGGGFPTWQKWLFSKNVESDKKYIMCNADEGDPGAYMDRSTLEGDPHSIIEAMAIAGHTINSSEGIIYIRAEYPLAIKRLQIAIDQAREYGLLGDNILGSNFSFDIEMRYGAGAFVCGEETALIASAEGRRGMPIPRPPFPAVQGLWKKPTVINNVETYANIPVIILKGGDWFSKIGTEDSKGTKVFAVTGKVAHSGLIEVPMGTSLRKIIFDICGGISNNKKFKAAQSGGPSGGMIPEKYIDTPIDYKNLQDLGSIMGSGGLIVMDEDDCMLNVAKFYLEFTVDESCGKCSPCRIGGRTLYNLLCDISKGKGTMKDIKAIEDLAFCMQKASLCGLGQTAPNPVLSVLRHFKEEFLAHIKQKKCPAAKCKELIRFYIQPEKCVGCTKCARKCPVGAIMGEKGRPHVINIDKCIKCGICYETCFFDAIIRK